MESAFAKGHAEFMASLGLTGKPLLTTVMYLFGFNVVKDTERGLVLVRKARDQHFD